MQLRLLLFISLIVGSLACAHEPPAVTGRLIMVPEVESFRPCGSSEPLWLYGDVELLRTLRAEHFELKSEPYAPTIAVLIGSVGPQLDCGFCEDFEGSFHVERVVSHSAFREAACQ